jgi:eukaryotic-like serine/threonine-protein kinase
MNTSGPKSIPEFEDGGQVVTARGAGVVRSALGIDGVVSALTLAVAIIRGAPMPLVPGTRLGPYEIVAAVGSGGMGEVYRARDTRLGRHVAVKVLPASLSTDPDRLRRFQKEATTAGLLSHPNILAIHDVGSHDGAPYVVSELLEGENLRACIGPAGLPLRKAIDYAVQIAQGLAAAHDKGIVHRDLKPENVFVTQDGRVKILDFGIAKLIQTESSDGDNNTTSETLTATRPDVVLGTVGYMSPEQVRGRVVDHRSDIFSFGVILYEMLTGHRAFRGDSDVEAMHAILSQDPLETTRLDRALPPPLERIVRHCLEKRLDERFQSARDVAFDLEAALSAPTAPATPIKAPLWLPTRRQVVLGLGLLAFTAAGYLSGRGSGTAPIPTFRQLTFRRGTVVSARFAPDGQTVVYAAAWDGHPVEVFSTRLGSAESRSLGLAPAGILAVSSAGEMALSLGGTSYFGIGSGTLARAPLAGGTPREVARGVQFADWSPAGDEFVLVRDYDGKCRLELPPGHARYETAGWLSHPRVAPDGSTVAVLDHPVRGDDRGSVVLVRRDGTRDVLSEGWSSVQGLAWSGQGREVWFTGERSGVARALWAVTLKRRERLVARVAGPMTLEDIGADGSALLVHGRDRVGMAFTSAEDGRERDLSWLDRSISTDLSPDGTRLLFYESGDGGGAGYGVYLRKTDGSPAVRLGEGMGTAISPDGEHVAAIVHRSPQRLVLMPTGAGETRTLEPGSIESYHWASFFPGGDRLLVTANEPGRGTRLYVQEVAGGPPHPITPEGTRAFWDAVSPDGKRVLALSGDLTLSLYPIAGGEAVPLRGQLRGDVPIRWGADGRTVFLSRRFVSPQEIIRLRLGDGRREGLRAILPLDPAGITAIFAILATPDGRAYGYTYGRVLSDLYLTGGLR